MRFRRSSRCLLRLAWGHPRSCAACWCTRTTSASSRASSRSIPALRRKLLTGGPGISDEEIAPGVEDLQFRVGADVDGDGAIDSYFEPEAVPAGARAVCVQLWLRMRSVERSGAAAAFGATSYADRTWPASNDGFARMLVTKTIHVRNGRP